ncbi:hypothetical protein ACFWFF_01615 [Streptomyces sp. NPDC060223]|uniref:hypothetical protein n=1 Tax=unclassified Streptomyces TaxID=2593676 RepID=UPI0036345AE5
MAFIPFPGWNPGMVMTADRLNSAALVGRVVFLATRDTAQSVPNSTDGNPVLSNAMIWESITLDDLGGWAAGSPTRYTCQLAGWYHLNGGISYAFNATGLRAACWFESGALVPGGHGARSQATSGAGVAAVNARSIPVLLGVGDYIELAPGQNSGAALNTSTASARPHMSITFTGHA